MVRSRGLRVLLACGQGDVEKVVRAAGHEVRAVCDGPSALTAARSLSLDVVILDLEECGDPFELARKVREASPWHKPMFIGLTSAWDGEERCRAAGIDLVFFKPVEMALLAGLLRQLEAVLEEYAPFDPVI